MIQPRIKPPRLFYVGTQIETIDESLLWREFAYIFGLHRFVETPQIVVRYYLRVNQRSPMTTFVCMGSRKRETEENAEIGTKSKIGSFFDE